MIRFFGSSECEQCAELHIIFTKYDIEYEYINALDSNEEVQLFCDLHDVEDLPHIQFLDSKEDMIFEHRGPISDGDFIKYYSLFGNKS